MKKKLCQVILLLFCLLGISLFLEHLRVDQNLSALIYHQHSRWPGIGHQPWTLLYRLAPVPGLLLGFLGMVLFVASWIRPHWQRVRRPGLFLALALALGPGLLINVGLKDQMGRARPRELTEYGKNQVYTPFWRPGESGTNSSFPSGHAGAAFYCIAPFFIFRRSRPRLALAWLGGGLAWGSLTGLGRLLEGAHFFSDIVWAGVLIYLTCDLLATWLRPDRPAL